MKALGSLWQYYIDELALDNNASIFDFPADNDNSILSRFKEKVTEQAGKDGTRC